jgi:DNA modification methylase
MKKYFDDSWDFIGADTKRLTHCFHNYPAMMIPQVAERLIEKYGKNAKVLFDPYCGTGTSLLEANLKNINALGTDLNPLARLISTAKTTKINLQILDLYLKEFSDFVFAIMFDIQKVNAVIPNAKNIDYWFEESVQEKLGVIKHFIGKIEDKPIANFFKTAFSETVRESSWTRNSEFKMFRMTAEQIKKFNPDVFGLMQSKLARNRKGVKDLIEKSNHQVRTKVFDFDSAKDFTEIEQKSIDIVVTSPPYGDSRTTVAYGQFSRLANEWLDVDKATQIDGNLMGGKVYRNRCSFDFSLLDQVIDKIAESDEKRAKEVSAFYCDYQNSINNVAKTVRKNGYVCYVVGNRKVKGLQLPTDLVTKNFFELQGFEHIETIIRNIPNKRMPSKNSPTNIVGELGETMSKEFIVVLKKVC